MIKSAMRQALKNSLMSMKQGMRDRRAKSHLKEGSGDDEDYMGEGGEHSSYSSEDVHRLDQGKGLSGKVREAEAEGMSDLEAQHPSEMESEGSAYEEAHEPMAEAMAEGDEWREEQKDFMKGRIKPSGKKTAIMIAIDAKPSKAGKGKTPSSFFKKG